jgi:hypothetical protein
VTDSASQAQLILYSDGLRGPAAKLPGTDVVVSAAPIDRRPSCPRAEIAQELERCGIRTR